MISFKSVDDLFDFINNFDGAGLIVTDDEELRAHLSETPCLNAKINELAGEITGDDIAFEIKYKDLLATGSISDWITRAEMEGVNGEKIAKAQRQLRLVTDFQAKHPNQCQMPD